jgi:hypothetical protein
MNGHALEVSRALAAGRVVAALLLMVNEFAR